MTQSRRASLLLCVALLLLTTSCENGLSPSEDTMTPSSHAVGALGNVGGVGNGDDSRIVFQDAGDWTNWSVRTRSQSWSQVDKAIKWISFMPQANNAVSPEFAGVQHFEISFDVYFPARFPVFGTSAPGATTLFGLSAFDPNAPADDGMLSELSIDLFEGRTWRIHTHGFDPSSNFEWDSADRFLTPWAFQHGWNSLVWTIEIVPGLGNDTMRLKVGDNIFAWTDVNIAGMSDPFRFLRIGAWEIDRGDRHFAVRNVVIEDLAERMPPPSEDPPGEDPPSEDPPGEGPPTDPPPPPPPSDPPPPPPPIEGDFAEGGYIIRDGFWEDWRVRTHAQGSHCEGNPCVRFLDVGGHGGFRAATQGVRYIGVDEDGQGTLSFDVFFGPDQLDTDGGGKHLVNVTSHPLVFTPRDIGLDNWTRIDFNQPKEGRVRATIFNIVGGKALNGTAWPNHWFDVPFEEGSWGRVEIEWRQVNDRLTVTVGNESHTFDLLPGSPLIGNYIAFGNMDSIGGEIEVANLSWSQ